MDFWYPNRPLLISIDSPKIDELSSDQSWVAEIKKNGDRLCLHYDGEGFYFFNRHQSILKYDPPAEMMKELKSLNLPRNTILDGELMHNHTKNVKNLIYFYDVYVYNNKKVDLPFCNRRILLQSIIPEHTIFQHLTISHQYTDNFRNLFHVVIEKEENEGLVIKNLNGMISWNMFKSEDVSWQIKIRKETKGYKA
jgi:ATP-dependent DNA ligase